MPRFLKWLLASVAAVLLGLVAALLGVQHWLGTADFRQRVSQEASQALGVPVSVGRVTLDWWPLPALALDEVQIETRPALSVQRIEVRPDWTRWSGGRPTLSTLVVRHAVLPQVGIDSLLNALQKRKLATQAPRGPEADSASNLALMAMFAASRVLLDDLTWQGPRNELLGVDADLRLGPDAWPATVKATVLKARLKGVGDLQGSTLSLQREGAGYQLALALRGAGGGTGGGTGGAGSLKRGAIKGRVDIDMGGAGRAGLVVTGKLDTTDFDVALVGEPKAQQSPPLTGRLEAQTTLSAKAPQASGLLDALQTDSRFTVRNAVVHGIDLAKAVKSVGLSRGGETRLDVLAGQLHTRGKTIQLTNLVASSGALTASGDVTVSPARTLSGRVYVALGNSSLPAAAKDAVGVPLVVGGTLDAPEVTLTRAALIGAAIGTAVLPGVGTGAGASLGDRVGEKLKGLFGGKK